TYPPASPAAHFSLTVSPRLNLFSRQYQATRRPRENRLDCFQLNARSRPSDSVSFDDNSQRQSAIRDPSFVTDEEILYGHLAPTRPSFIGPGKQHQTSAQPPFAGGRRRTQAPGGASSPSHRAATETRLSGLALLRVFCGYRSHCRPLRLANSS